MNLSSVLRQTMVPTRLHHLLPIKQRSFSSILLLRQYAASRQLKAITHVCSIHGLSTQILNQRTHVVESPLPLFKPQLQSIIYHSNSLVIERRTLFTTNVYLKKKKQTAAAAADTDEDTEEEQYESGLETDSDEDDEDGVSDEEEGVPKDYKDIHHNLGSLRIDAVLSKGLNISRKKIEDDYLGTKLRLNGSVVTKKGKQVKVGDTLDLIRGYGEDDMVSVMRLVLKKVLADKTSKGNTRVVLRRWKNLKIPKSEL